MKTSPPPGCTGVLPVAGIILAAGKSSRMGANKLLLPLADQPVLQHVLDATQDAPLTPLILVVPPEHAELRAGLKVGRARLCISQRAGQGYAFSLQAGLQALASPCAGAMFIAGDQPLVTTATLTTLVTAFLEDTGRWVAPTWQGRRGNPVIVPASWFGCIFALDGDTGPRHHLDDPATRLRLIPVDDQGILLDIDTPEDLALLATLARPGKT